MQRLILPTATVESREKHSALNAVFFFDSIVILLLISIIC